MSFAWPWCFALLPLPWLLRRAAPFAAAPALRVPRLPALAGAAAQGRVLPWIAVLAWLLLVAAAARPQLPDEARIQPVNGRDLLLAFDVSASMATVDLQVDGRPLPRIAAARRFADAFLSRRAGDRVGLIVFATQAYLHTPPSFDLDAVRAALATADIGLAGRETALGDAIALAVKHLRDQPARDRVLVVVSDGANTAGTLAPPRAAWLARRAGVRVHAVGIGSARRGDVDEAALRGIAAQTGGRYALATDGAALAEFWRHIEAVEPIAHGEALRPVRELYPWPLSVALLLVAGLAARRLCGAAA